MPRFLFIYRRRSDVGSRITPEAMQQTLEKWYAWIGEGLRAGWMVERGEALTQEGRVVRAKNVVTDGPFVETKEIVGGYSIVQADSLDAAAELTHGCPAFESGGFVEVRQVAVFSTET